MRLHHWQADQDIAIQYRLGKAIFFLPKALGGGNILDFIIVGINKFDFAKLFPYSIQIGDGEYLLREIVPSPGPSPIVILFAPASFTIKAIARTTRQSVIAP